MKLRSTTRRVLRNGLTIIYGHTPDSSAFEISLNIDTGSRDENKEINGVSHLLEHMMFRGTRKCPNSLLLARAMERFGGESNAITSVEHTSYWLKGSSKLLSEAIDVFADFFFDPIFDEFETERNIVLQELAGEYNEDGQNIDAESLGMETLFQPHPMGLPVIGTEEGVKNLTLEDLKKKRDCFYRPTRSLLIITGHMPPEHIMNKIESVFEGSWTHCSDAEGERLILPEKLLKPLSRNRKPKHLIKLQNNADNQYVMKLMFPAFGGHSRDVVLQTVLQRVLDDGITARLPSTVRETHGLVYDISCDANAYTDIGTFSIDLAVHTDNLAKLFPVLQEQLLRILLAPPTVEELEHVKFRYNFDLQTINEDAGRLLGREIWNHFIKKDVTIDEEVELVTNTTPEDVLRTAQTILNAAHKAVVLIGPKARKKRKDVEEFLSVLR